MPNLLESSQTTETVAPDYYKTYMSDLASKGSTAANNAQYVGATDLQNKAFTGVEGASTAYQPTLNAAGNTLTNATDVTSPLAAANPYLAQATSDPSKAAANYMTPYMRSVVDALGDAGQRNIQQNLSPLATAGAVGAGQFGSKRGAEVLGQTEANANRDILNAQSQALNTGYQSALNAALQQNQIANTAGATASNAAGTGQANLINAGTAQGNLATTNQNLALKGVNALDTLGQEQQTIAQNKELFPLQNLTTEAALLRGYNVPTTTKTTAQASPLATLAGATTGLAGMFTKNAAGQTPYDALTGGLKTAYEDLIGTKPTTPNTVDAAGNPTTPNGPGNTVVNQDGTPTVRTFTDANSPTGYVDAQGNTVYENGDPYEG
jgi:hypothetical protein